MGESQKCLRHIVDDKDQLPFAKASRQYRKSFSSVDEELNYCIRKNHNHFTTLLKEMEAGNNKLLPEQVLLDVFIKQLSGVVLPENIHVPQINFFLQKIKRLGSTIQAMIDKPTSSDEMVDKDLQEAGGDMQDIAINFLKREFSTLLPSILLKINFGEISDACLSLINAATMLGKSCQKSINAAKRLQLDFWLKDHCKLRDDYYTEILALVDLRSNIKQASVSIDTFLSAVITKRHSIRKYDGSIEEELCSSEAYRKLNNDEQWQVLIDVKIHCLHKLLLECEENIKARINIEAHDNNKAMLKRILLSHYHDYNQFNACNEMIAAINHPKPKLYEQKHAAFIKKLKIDRDKQVNKVIARGLIVLSLALSLTLVVAVIAVAPPFTMILLTAGIVSSLLLAKIFNKNDSLDKIKQNGAKLIDDLFRTTDESSPVVLTTKQSVTEVNRTRIANKLSSRYKKIIKKYTYECAIEETFFEEHRMQDSVIIKNNYQSRERILSQKMIIQSNDIPKLTPLLSHLQNIDNTIGIYYTYLSIDKLKSFIDQLTLYVKNLLDNVYYDAFANMFTRLDMVSMMTKIKQVISVAAYSIVAINKCYNAKKMLNFDVWLGNSLASRFNAQLELQRLQRFANAFNYNHFQNNFNLPGEEYWYNLLFESLDKESQRQLNKLSLIKFRIKVNELNVKHAAFLQLSDAEQIYVMAMLDICHMKHKIKQCEFDILVRAKVEFKDNKDHSCLIKLIKNINENYLTNDDNLNHSFKNDLLTNLLNNSSPTPAECAHNALIKSELKNNVEKQGGKIAARLLLLLCAGLTLAAVMAACFAASPFLIGELIAGAFMAMAIAKMIRQGEGFDKILSKGIETVFYKVHNSLTLWKPQMALKNTLDEDCSRTPIHSLAKQIPSG